MITFICGRYIPLGFIFFKDEFVIQIGQENLILFDRGDYLAKNLFVGVLKPAI